ncbi:MAG: LexA DNA-binding domain protein [Deltaproteobacteria bacterium]|nr:LexA DNA-binding domain protein [Deltaproteobacteria bacterium]
MKMVRRKDRAIDLQDALAVLAAGEYGVLSTVGRDGQPYGVPLSYTCKNRCIYFHCALDGHKIENIASNPKVSFCVVGRTNILPEKFATEYESVVVFGVAAEVHGAERSSALVWLLEKYSPGFMAEGRAYIEQKDKAVKVMKIEINHISGKARR